MIVGVDQAWQEQATRYVQHWLVCLGVIGKANSTFFDEEVLGLRAMRVQCDSGTGDLHCRSQAPTKIAGTCLVDSNSCPFPARSKISRSGSPNFASRLQRGASPALRAQALI